MFFATPLRRLFLKDEVFMSGCEVLSGDFFACSPVRVTGGGDVFRRASGEFFRVCIVHRNFWMIFFRGLAREVFKP